MLSLITPTYAGLAPLAIGHLPSKSITCGLHNHLSNSTQQLPKPKARGLSQQPSTVNRRHATIAHMYLYPSRDAVAAGPSPSRG